MTITQFTSAMQKLGYKIGERQARRMLTELKIEFACGKRGRPSLE